ncbi:MAG: dihydrofolate synthase / folylpolyglutamate synthase [Chloroflexota bacterium]|nr:dihydrofolate synthase / folylpolyglutamate synthase [Chloroflexota bacterium]
MPNIEEQYQQALDYIYSFIDYSLTRNLRYSADKFNLDRMVAFMQLLGNPQNDYKVIHVAGTKGKGSTSAMLTSILTCAGYKVGFYSSPHMLDFNERIRIGDALISNQQLVDLVNTVRAFVPLVRELTTFEIITGMAFLYFSQQEVDYAVIEVGMGGRLDATNVVNPLLSIITSISHDHMKVLGSTLAKIATEKAGIIKPGVPVVMSNQKKSPRETITAIAEERSAPLYTSSQIFDIQHGAHSLEGQHFRFSPLKGNPFGLQLPSQEFFIPLIGDHQLENARTAYTALQVINQQGAEMSDTAIRQGFRALDWPGRMEVISRDPLIIVDGAHNRDSFRRFSETIQTYLPGRKKILIFGASEDKEVELMLGRIQPWLHELIITKAQHPRALEGEIIASKAEQMQIPFCVTQSVEEALERAIRDADDQSVILAAGSIFIAGAVKNVWNNQGSRKK